ncbi:MAG: LacI family DNA-binding transcriptional regulator [Christensenellales bacterium]|jgi:DNA-binding LacI/PurR family transcriptional regulator
MNRVTIKDVAQLAGVSATTVSHVINNTRFVNEETRLLVERAIKELNYQPNQLARSLRLKSTKTIGILVSDINLSHFTNIVRACEDYAYNHGYNTILCNTDEDPKKEKLCVNILLQKQVDGIIISPTCKNKTLIKSLLASGTPIVLIDRYIKGLDANYVGYDNYQASYDAVSHMIEMGYKKISILYSMGYLTVVQDRINGYRKAMQDHNLAFDLHSEIEIPVNFDHEIFNQTIDVHFKKQRPDGIFSAEQKLALYTMRYLRSNNLSSPKDVGLVNFGDYSWFDDFSPSISAISIPVYSLGEAAVSILLSMINKNHTKSKQISLPTQFHIRHSSQRISGVASSI